MKHRNGTLKVLGGGFISLGILFGFILCTLMVWGDVEASVFTDGLNGDTSIKTLKCPVFITPKETGTISLVLRNPTDREFERFLKASITEGYATLVREIRTKVPLSANAKQKVEWKIYPEDAAFKRVILFRVFINAKHPYPSMSGNCGVVRIDIPWLRGNQILAILSAISLACFAMGSVMREIGIQPATAKERNTSNAIYFLIGTLLFTALNGYFGFWLFGILGLAIAILLAGVIIFRR